MGAEILYDFYVDYTGRQFRKGTPIEPSSGARTEHELKAISMRSRALEFLPGWKVDGCVSEGKACVHLEKDKGRGAFDLADKLIQREMKIFSDIFTRHYPQEHAKVTLTFGLTDEAKHYLTIRTDETTFDDVVKRMAELDEIARKAGEEARRKYDDEYEEREPGT